VAWTFSNAKKIYLGDDNPRKPRLNLLKCDSRYETETTRRKESEKNCKVQGLITWCQRWKPKKYLQKILCRSRKPESTRANLMNPLPVIWDQDKKKKNFKEGPNKKDQSSLKKR